MFLLSNLTLSEKHHYFLCLYSESENVGKRRTSEKESVDCSPPEYVLPGCKDRPLAPLQPARDDWKVRD